MGQIFCKVVLLILILSKTCSFTLIPTQLLTLTELPIQGQAGPLQQGREQVRKDIQVSGSHTRGDREGLKTVIGRFASYGEKGQEYYSNVPTVQNDLQIQCNLYQNSNGILFTKTENTNLKFVWNHKRPWIAKGILREMNKAGDFTCSDFKLHDKAIIIKTVWCQNRHTHKWNRIESSETYLCIHMFSISLWQMHQEHTMGKDSLFNKWYWGNWKVTSKRMKLEPCLILHTKINSKWIIECKTGKCKTSGRNTSDRFLDIGVAMTLWIWHQKQGEQKQQ